MTRLRAARYGEGRPRFALARYGEGRPRFALARYGEGRPRFACALRRGQARLRGARYGAAISISNQ